MGRGGRGRVGEEGRGGGEIIRVRGEGVEREGGGGRRGGESGEMKWGEVGLGSQGEVGSPLKPAKVSSSISFHYLPPTGFSADSIVSLISSLLKSKCQNEFWNRPASRKDPIWKDFFQLSQATQERLAAGFELIARKA